MFTTCGPPRLGFIFTGWGGWQFITGRAGGPWNALSTPMLISLFTIIFKTILPCGATGCARITGLGWKSHRSSSNSLLRNVPTLLTLYIKSFKLWIWQWHRILQLQNSLSELQLKMLYAHFQQLAMWGMFLLSSCLVLFDTLENACLLYFLRKTFKPACYIYIMVKIIILQLLKKTFHISKKSND